MRSRRALIMAGLFLLAWVALAGTAFAAPAITIAPADGANGGAFVADLSGFNPGESINLRLSTGEATPRNLAIPAIMIDATGRYSLTIPTLGLPPGEYTLAALRGGSVVASARFTVAATPVASPSTRPAPTTTRPAPTRTTTSPTPTAIVPPTPPSTGSGGYLPGLPNTGGGAMSGAPTTWLLLSLAPLMIVLVAARRRRSERIRAAIRHSGIDRARFAGHREGEER